MKTLNINKLSLKELTKLERQLESDIAQLADYFVDCGNPNFEDDQEIHEMGVMLDKVVKRILSL
jgi:hypothetical protein